MQAMADSMRNIGANGPGVFDFNPSNVVELIEVSRKGVSSRKPVTTEVTE